MFGQQPEVSLNEMVTLWEIAKDALDVVKANELKLRKQICEHVKGRDEGATSVSTDRFKVTVTRKINRTFDVAVLDTVLRDHPHYVGTVVKYKPSLALADYKQLANDDRRLLDSCIVAKPGTAALAVKLIPTD